MSIANSNEVWRRNREIGVRFCDGEIADIRLIALAWKCTPSQVIWVVMATWLCEDGRDRDIMNLPYTQHSKRILRKARDLEKAEMEDLLG